MNKAISACQQAGIGLIAMKPQGHKIRSSQDQQLTDHFCGSFCAGCGLLCDESVADAPVSDVLRYLMYCNSYGDRTKAKKLFREIPAPARYSLAGADFSLAEQGCPQGLPIGSLVREAVEKLG